MIARLKEGEERLSLCGAGIDRLSIFIDVQARRVSRRPKVDGRAP